MDHTLLNITSYIPLGASSDIKMGSSIVLGFLKQFPIFLHYLSWQADLVPGPSTYSTILCCLMTSLSDDVIGEPVRSSGVKGQVLHGDFASLICKG